MHPCGQILHRKREGIKFHRAIIRGGKFINRVKIAMNGRNTKKICKSKGFGRSGEISRTNVCVVPNDNLIRSFIFNMHRHILEFGCDVMRCPRVKHPTVGGRLWHNSTVSLCQHMRKLSTFSHSVTIKATQLVRFS